MKSKNKPINPWIPNTPDYRAAKMALLGFSTKFIMKRTKLSRGRIARCIAAMTKQNPQMTKATFAATFVRTLMVKNQPLLIQLRAYQSN